MSRRPCIFINKPGGCRNGTSCHFSHAINNQRTPSSPSSFSRQGIDRSAPPGVCYNYWSSGSCNREFQCKYKHESPPRSSSPGPAPQSPAIDKVPLFLTQEGLGKLSSSGTDVYFSNPAIKRSPTETHNSLKDFLYDNYRFTTAPQVYSFLSLLANASSTNAAWVSPLRYSIFWISANQSHLCRVPKIAR